MTPATGDWILSHWAHFTVHRFIYVHLLSFVYFYFILHMCCIIVSMVLVPDGIEAKSLGV